MKILLGMNAFRMERGSGLNRTGRTWLSKWVVAGFMAAVFSVAADAATYHVSVAGSDTNIGSETAPFKTVQKGASVAQAGDTVVIHEGTYREHVKPANGGTGETSRITYKAAEDEVVWIKGSEQITNWIPEGGGLWRVELPSEFFNGYNPYALTLSGSFLNYGQWHHRGNVYLNGEMYLEEADLAAVQGTEKRWHATTVGNITTITAHFGSVNPNEELAEISVRETVFFADVDGLDYITIDGIRFAHSANNWGPPVNDIAPDVRVTAAQIGMVMPRNCRSWIIENCIVEHAKCIGISIGRHAEDTPWPDALEAGHHIIRNNIIRYCGQAGIAGNDFNSFCLIEGNYIEKINLHDEFGGPETASLKIHNSVDTVIKGNCIRMVNGYGLWIDYSNQGTRLTGNIISGSSNAAIFLEKNWGPILVDNNVLIGQKCLISGCHGAVFVHNLFYNSGIDWANLDARIPSRYWIPHTREVLALPTPLPELNAYGKMYNNIVVGGEIKNFTGTGFSGGGNFYCNGVANNNSLPFQDTGVVSWNFNPNFAHYIIGHTDTIKFDLNSTALGLACEVMHDGNIGDFSILPDQGLEYADGSRIMVNNDLYGNLRNTSTPKVGPFETVGLGRNDFVAFMIPDIESVPSASPTQTPYTGTPITLPGLIQANRFDLGGEGVAYHDRTPDNLGDFRPEESVDASVDGNVGYFDAGEWLEYTVNVATSDTYQVRAKVSSAFGFDQHFHLEVDGIDVTDDMTFNTGSAGWSTYQSVILPDIQLVEGEHVIRFVQDSGLFNFQSLEFFAESLPIRIDQAAQAGTSTITVGSGTIVSVGAAAMDEGALIYSWSQLSGTGTANFTSADAASSGVSFTEAGEYTLQVTIGNGVTAVTSEVAVVVVPRRIFHVAKGGNDANSGGESDPFLTVNQAASVAVAGDTVMIHEGTYREHVKPRNGGYDESSRITFKAAEGEEVWIKGSEQVQSWVDEGGGVWRADFPAEFFNGFNPYTTYISGDFLWYGGDRLLGNVYLNGEVYLQKTALSGMQSTPRTWYASTAGNVTTIRANFGTANPNAELCEINVRETVFFADLPGLSYITVDGINFAHAANNWAPPLGSAQIGMVMPRDSRSWIIENCTLEHARSIGISIGRHNSWDWPGDLVNNGHHIIRNNIIRRCGQGGIAGNSFNSDCLIENNLIEDINYSKEFGGPETAGIKLHWSVDTVIKGNCIRRVSGDQFAYGIWIDYSNQGTRITGNTILQTQQAVIFLEANFGPILIDNNVFIGNQAKTYGTEGAVFVNNLFVDSGIKIDPMDDRIASYYVPHTLTTIYPGVKSGEAYEKAYNNIFIGGSNGFDGTGSSAGNNLYLNGIGKMSLDSTGVRSTYDPGFSYLSGKDEVSISFSLNDSPFGMVCDFIHDGNIGAFDIRPDQGLEYHDGSRIIVSNDLFGAIRQVANPRVGPFEDIQQGTNQYVLYRGADFGNTVQEPYSGSPAAVPGTVEAEAYDRGGEGISYHDTSVGNASSSTYRIFEDVDAGEAVVGWIDAGEWMEYTVEVAATGSYDAAVRASSGALGGTLHIEFDGVDITGPVSIPATGAWDNYVTLPIDGIPLSAGRHVMRVFAESGGWNLDYVAFTPDDGLNHAPVADDQSVNAVEALPKAILLSGSDTDGNPLTYSIVSLPLHGTLSGAPPNVVYTSAEGFSGADLFTFRVNDGVFDSPPATVSVSVEPGPDLIGVDDFDQPGVYSTRTITGGINTSGGITWGIVSRGNIQYSGMIDTSVAAGGSVAFDAGDRLGFLGTNKTDKIFGMYRSGPTRTLTYTFDISGLNNLNVAMDWAASGDIADKLVSMSYSIDGAAPTTSFVIGSSNDDWSETNDLGLVSTRNRSASVLVNGMSAASLSDVFQTYNPTISGSGSELTLTFVMGSTVGGYGGMGLDNLKLYGTPMVAPGYYGWIDTFGLSVSNALPTQNPDGDRLSNLAEYAFGGNPLVADDGYLPEIVQPVNTASGFLEYVYARRTTPNHGLIYAVETCPNLVSNDWTTAGVTELPVAGTISADFEAVTNRIPTAANEGFIRVRVE